MRREFTVVVFAVLGSFTSIGTAASAEVKNEHFATVQETTIQMHPSGASFQVPKNWGFNTANLSREELSKVKNPTGEWDAEYAKVANGALPFSDCSVQAGIDKWPSTSFFDLQVRGYVSELSESEIKNNISTKGLSAAKSLPSKTAHGASISEGESGPWHKIHISYDLWYGDYGGKAHVEFYVRSHESWTVVLMFMHSNTYDPAVIEQILQSFSWAE